MESDEGRVIVGLDQTFRSTMLKQHFLEVIDSIIINHSQYLQLFKNKLNCKHTPTLLYRGTRDSFTKSEFHKHVDDHKNLVVLVKSKEGDLFCAFTTARMNFSDGNASNVDSFAFRFDNSQLYQFRLDTTKVYTTLTKYVDSYLFAFNFFFWIGDQADKETRSSSYSGGIDTYMQKEYVILDKTILTNSRYFGGHNFLVEEMEVFTIV